MFVILLTIEFQFYYKPVN